jgi:hypothetical protein
MTDPGSPEAIAAALEAKEKEAAELAAKAKAEAGNEDETVTLTKAEHDALQARARILEKQERDAKAAEAAKKAAAEKKALEDRLKAAEEAGQGKALREAEEEKAALQARLDAVLTGNAVRDAASARKWSASQQRAAAKLGNVDALEKDPDTGIPTDESLEQMLDSLAEDYPDIFTGEAKSDAGKKAFEKKKAVKTPAQPAIIEEASTVKFDGYISPEEYLNTPFEQRQTNDFRKRLEQSRAFWADTFDHKQLASDS